jgi:hypothetical protein
MAGHNDAIIEKLSELKGEAKAQETRLTRLDESVTKLKDEVTRYKLIIKIGGIFLALFLALFFGYEQHTGIPKAAKDELNSSEVGEEKKQINAAAIESKEIVASLTEIQSAAGIGAKKISDLSNDLQSVSTEKGFLVLGDMQICWGSTEKKGVNFDFSFPFPPNAWFDGAPRVLTGFNPKGDVEVGGAACSWAVYVGSPQEDRFEGHATLVSPYPGSNEDKCPNESVVMSYLAIGKRRHQH